MNIGTLVTITSNDCFNGLPGRVTKVHYNINGKPSSVLVEFTNELGEWSKTMPRLLFDINEVEERYAD